MTWLTVVCEMTHLYMWHDALMYVTWLIHTYDVTHRCTWYDSFIHMTRISMRRECEWLIHMWDMTHSYVGHDSFICGTWLIHMWDMTHSYIWHDALIYVTWLIHIYDVTYWYIWNDSWIFVTWCTHMYPIVIFVNEDLLRWGWVFVKRTRILSGIQLQGILSNSLLWKRNNSSVVIQTGSWRGKPAASALLISHNDTKAYGQIREWIGELLGDVSRNCYDPTQDKMVSPDTAVHQKKKWHMGTYKNMSMGSWADV